MGRKGLTTPATDLSTSTINHDGSVKVPLPPPSSSIPTTFTDSLPLPTLMVFDLDYTLWPFWVDTHVSPPLKPANKDGSMNIAMQDRYGEKFTFYPEVPGLLYEMRRRGIVMGLASRTHTPDLAAVMLRGISVPVPEHYKNKPANEESSSISQEDTKTAKDNLKPMRAMDFFTYKEMYPGSKIRHFKSIQNATRKVKIANREVGKEGVPFDEMLFFDDEGRNRDVERELGVTFVLVRDGVTKDEVDRGVWEWRKRKGIGGQKDGQGKNVLNGDADEWDNS